MSDESTQPDSGENEDVTRWIEKLEDEEGDSRAAELIWNRFFKRMVGVAQKKMVSMPKAARDEEDVALSAMNSFFEGAEAGRFEVKNRDDLWRLLVTITIRKASAERRRQYAAKRGGGKPSLHINQNTPDRIDELIDRNQMPELVEDVLKSCSELLDTLNDEALRHTAEMKMQGCSLEEISDVLGCKVEETKYRLRKIRFKWKLHYK